MPVRQTLDRFNLDEGDTALELGPGPGYFSIEASRMIGPTGRLLCLDIQPGMAVILRERLRAEGSDGQLVVGDAIQLPLAGGSVDKAFLVAMLGEIPDRPAALAELRRVDPEAESFIDPRNVRRVIRALEVYAETGKPFTYWRRKDAPSFETVVIGLRVAREALYERIDARVDAMIADGMVGEVKSLLKRGYSRELPSMSGIGYGEMCASIAGEMTIEEAIERTKTRTHGFARHQNSWFKPSDERIQWIDGAEDGIRTVDEALGSVGTAGRTA